MKCLGIMCYNVYNIFSNDLVKYICVCVHTVRGGKYDKLLTIGVSRL